MPMISGHLGEHHSDWMEIKGNDKKNKYTNEYVTFPGDEIF